MPFPPPGDRPDPGIQPASPALAGGVFTTVPPAEAFLKAPFVNTAETNTGPSVPHPHPQRRSVGTSLPPSGSLGTLPRLHHRGQGSCSEGPTCILNMGLPSPYPAGTPIPGLTGCLPIICTAWSHTEGFISQQRKSSPCHPPPPHVLHSWYQVSIVSLPPPL